MDNQSDFTDKVVWITGASSGIFRELSIYNNTMTADECARQILLAVARRSPEVVIRSHPVRVMNRMVGWIPVLGRKWRPATP